ncbi:Plant methyltransferase dimerization [Dillenia turbinata]|uniref:Plant methyltransferase dimerization n=1 Tax=Dillenia turbinata TaxID=194707 RepID=A0AAN8ULB4_9MAGN
MVNVGGRERTEKEWKRLFFEAGYFMKISKLNRKRYVDLFRWSSSRFRAFIRTCVCSTLVAPEEVKCAIQLGISDIIHGHTRPITLPELVSALQISPTRASCLQRLMRSKIILQALSKLAQGMLGSIFSNSSGISWEIGSEEMSYAFETA